MSISPAGIVSGAQWITNARNGGGTYDPEGYGYRWRIVLHTIEGSTNPGMIAGHAYPPHLWYDPPTRRLYQTVPLGRSAFALYQASDAPHYTNRARALQVEISGRAAETASWPQQWLDNLTADVIVPLCQWVASQGGSINLNNAPAPGPDSMSATENAAQRLTPLAWALFDGICSHRHVPMGDDHWDTGQLDTPRLAQHAAMLIGGQLVTQSGRTTPATTAEDDDMSIIVQLNEPGDAQHGTMWAVDGVFKRRINTMEEVNRLLDTGAARKQPPNAAGLAPGWAVWNLAQLRPLMTVEEWSLAGLPELVSAAVAARFDRSLADLPNRIAMAVASALQSVPKAA